VLCPAFIFIGLAEAVMLQLLTLTVTAEVQTEPPPVGVQVAVYVVVTPGVTTRLLPFPAPLFQLTVPPVQPVYDKVELCPALMFAGEAEALILQLVTLTVTEEVQTEPPPVGVQVAT